jgi:hypothetical protein
MNRLRGMKLSKAGCRGCYLLLAARRQRRIQITVPKLVEIGLGLSMAHQDQSCLWLILLHIDFHTDLRIV